MSLLTGVRQGQQQGESLFIAGHFAQIDAQTPGQSQQQCSVAQVSFYLSLSHSLTPTDSIQTKWVSVVNAQCCHLHGDRLADYRPSKSH